MRTFLKISTHFLGAYFALKKVSKPNRLFFFHIVFCLYLCNRIPKLRSKMYIALTWVGVSLIF